MNSLAFNNLKYLEEYEDMYGIYKRIKNINPYYKLYFNKKDKCFVVVNTDNGNEICYSFNSFNHNILKSLAKSQVKNAREIFEEIELHNEKIESDYKKQSKEMLKAKIEDLYRYSKRTNKITDSDINKIIGV